MKTIPSVAAAPPILDVARLRVGIRQKLAALVELTKPRIAVMVLLTVAVGFLCGDRRALREPAFWWTIVGTACVAGGASAWNQILERDRDALMKRTRNRPLPSGRVGWPAAAWFATILTLLGLSILLTGANRTAALVALTTFSSYVFLYTPLKPLTTLNTLVGALPGALPPVIGWTAATGHLDRGALALFLIQFFWQFPHFLAIAWIYRDDYARGGYRMLPILDPGGRRTARQATLYALALVPASLLPTIVGFAGRGYLVGALCASLFYLACSARFWLDPSESTARRLMFSSFFYLPAILLLLVIDPAHSF